MSEKGIYSPVFRRVITVVLFAGVSSAILAIYYLVFLPQQHEQFNQRSFRILREITNNFSLRVSNYGTAYSNGYIGNKYKETPFTTSALALDDLNLAGAFKKTFTGEAERMDSFVSVQRIVNDSIIYEIRKGGTLVSTPHKALNEILDPLISIHANTFESVLLIKQQSDTLRGGKAQNKFDSILYKSSGSNITAINTDSMLFSKNIIASALSDIEIEGVSYKMFLYPFQVKAISNGTFVIAGLITQKNYRQQSQSVPLNFLFGIGFLLILMLLILPFLKIFVLSTHENITIADVRMIVAVVFIIPFVITLFTSVIWLYEYPDDFSTDVLSSMQDSIKNNFYKEIRQCVQQAKDYDALMNKPDANVAVTNGADKKKWNDSISRMGLLDIKDIFLYPRYYRNLQSVHWMNDDGNDIAVWSFIKQPATYFKLKDRQYFTDIKYNKGYSLPGSKDTFSIQPALSRLTGEYTINMAIASRIILNPQKITAVEGISSKMYSLYNTVVPAGFGYSLIDEKGDILSHSDTARNLQENLFEETTDNHSLHLAINHKDSLLINDIDLYDQPVKMMIKPLPGLPYYLVTYCEKRGGYLFITHILAFVFLSQSVILLFVSLFSYCIMVADKKLYKLFFIPDGLNWIKPSIYKKEYYIKNSFQLLVCVFLVFLFSFFLPPAHYYLYMLNASLLLPLFATSGYYIIKRARVFTNNYENKNDLRNSLFLHKAQFIQFVKSIKGIMALYIISIFIFGMLQNILLYDSFCTNGIQVKVSIWTLITIMPFIMCLVSVTNFRVLKIIVRRVFNKYAHNFRSVRRNNNNYLTHFIISLLISVFVVSVIPAITFTGYALHEERKLHFQSFQIELAKRIQQRRAEINNKFRQTKVLQLPADGNGYIDSLKFKKDKGLYLYSNELAKQNFIPNSAKASNSCSPFYRLLTQFLFLPPDHDEFYDNPTHNSFYKWKESFDKQTLDSLSLSYKNLSDYQDTSSIVLKAGIPRFYIFKGITENHLGLLIILALLIFIFLFYKVIHSVARRVFLVGYFENPALKFYPVQHRQKDLQKHKYTDVNLAQFCEPFFPTGADVTFEDIRKKENELLQNDKDGGEAILKLHLALTPVYEKKWGECSDIEKFTLYDFALDGFTNYKKVITLYELYSKGLLVKEDENFILMTKSFRNFLISKESSKEIKILSSQVKGSWATLRSGFYIVLIAVAIFIFISQEEASKRLITIVTSLGALLPVILKLFNKSTFASSGTKSET